MLGCLTLPDGRLLLNEFYDAVELIGPYGAAEGRVWEYDRFHWPTIRDPETGEQWPVELPYNVLRSGYGLSPIAVQQGPFLRVVGMGDGCLPIVAEALASTTELTCAVERVLLQDLGESVEVNSLTLHKVKTPAGIEGWANDRYLE